MTDAAGPTAPGPDAPARPGRWLRIALVLSLMLNLLVLGAFVGRALRPDPFGPRAVVLRDLSFGPYTDALSPADRDALRADFARRAPGLREALRLHREGQAAVLAALRAEPFDPAALDAALAEQARRLTERAAAARAVLVARIAAMPPEARAAYADRLAAAFARGPGGREGREGRGERPGPPRGPGLP